MKLKTEEWRHSKDIFRKTEFDKIHHHQTHPKGNYENKVSGKCEGIREIRDALYWCPVPAIMIQSDETKA